MGSNELGWVRLEVDLLLSTRMARALTTAERVRLLQLVRCECGLVGLGDDQGPADLVPRAPRCS